MHFLAAVFKARCGARQGHTTRLFQLNHEESLPRIEDTEVWVVYSFDPSLYHLSPSDGTQHLLLPTFSLPSSLSGSLFPSLPSHLRTFRLFLRLTPSPPHIFLFYPFSLYSSYFPCIFPLAHLFHLHIILSFPSHPPLCLYLFPYTIHSFFRFFLSAVGSPLISPPIIIYTLLYIS